jgi:hypothetical protein
MSPAAAPWQYKGPYASKPQQLTPSTAGQGIGQPLDIVRRWRVWGGTTGYGNWGAAEIMRIVWAQRINTSPCVAGLPFVRQFSGFVDLLRRHFGGDGVSVFGDYCPEFCT